MSQIDLANVDLLRTPCPRGTQIEIEGLRQLRVELPCLNGLFSGIATVYAIFTRGTVFEDEHFLKRITLIDIDVKKKWVKVRVAAD